MKTYVASKNAEKLRELRQLFAGSPLELDSYDGYADVAEDATSYIGNAMLKARALHRQLTEAGIEGAVIADDSGLEVDALGGRPGLYSARYAGADASWTQRRGTLLEEMEGVADPGRTARFVCVIGLIGANGEPRAAVGTVEGHIAMREIGENGFGYDPIFFYKPLKRTFAELTAEEKNAVSHRGRAADALLSSLRSDA
ncbi:MAG TPA: RdgB/HAM1 family non-canonical purine NTP pyrophosphatase [Candidatus Baltobacteraceae bacterium]|nr:RdgB/HAM1 family non-canonical purine NTP pyrophosphatase [Candidatus Baltobacteraceae bacterium]